MDELYLTGYPLALGRAKRVVPATGIERRFVLAKAIADRDRDVGLPV